MVKQLKATEPEPPQLSYTKEGAEEGGDADGIVRHDIFRAHFEDAWLGALDGEE